MRRGAPKKLADEAERGGVEREVMGENAGRLAGIRFTEAARAQMRGEPLGRLMLADENAPALPRDQVDVRVDLGDEWNRRAARAEPRQPVQAGRRKLRHDIDADPVPWRDEHGMKPGPEGVCQPMVAPT